MKGEANPAGTAGLFTQRHRPKKHAQGDDTSDWALRANTLLKKEAAGLWCDRMTRAGQGQWRHLFVRQAVFERALKDGIDTLADLVAFVQAKEIPPPASAASMRAPGRFATSGLRVRPKGASVKEDIGIYHWMLRARNFLETAIRGASSLAKS